MPLAGSSSNGINFLVPMQPPWMVEILKTQGAVFSDCVGMHMVCTVYGIST